MMIFAWSFALVSVLLVGAALAYAWRNPSNGNELSLVHGFMIMGSLLLALSSVLAAMWATFFPGFCNWVVGMLLGFVGAVYLAYGIASVMSYPHRDREEQG